MHRFFIPADWINENRVVIHGSQVHQLRDVLRLRKGDRIAVLDNSGHEYEVTLVSVGREQVYGVVAGRRLVEEPRARVTLYQAMLKGNKFDFMLQKCTELGVARFVPMVCQRCVAANPAASETKLERWHRIIVEASEQSGRGKLPALERSAGFEHACQSASGLSLLPWERENRLGLRQALHQQGSRHRGPVEVSLFVGPEGGFTPGEAEFAESCGIVPVTLGRRVLRAETAGLVAATVVFYQCGDLDPASKG
ncbi:MAG: RsmE family RNA methyltransferase [Chloroflexota bacterium]